MTRNQILEAKEDPRSKSDELIEWEGRRAAYVMGEYHKQIGKRMQQYWVAAYQKEYEEGYKGVQRPEFEDENFEQFVKVNTNH